MMFELTKIATFAWPFGHEIKFFCGAETNWQTKRSDFVLTVRLSVAQGLARRLGLSNDIPNESKPDCGVAIAIVTCV
jgi:hypothetical protein